MSADTRTRLMDGLGRKRSSFRGWRGQRPFWGGLLTLLAGIPIMYIPYQNLTLGSLTIRMSTTAGAGSLIIGVLLVVLGLTMWFQPQSRVFAGVAAILLSLVSLVVSNVGAFLIGFLLGLFGGALGVAWAPDAKSGKRKRRTPADGTDPDSGQRPAGPAPSPADAAGPAGAAGPASAPGGTGPAGGTGADAAADDLSVFGTASGTGADANGRHRAG